MGIMDKKMDRVARIRGVVDLELLGLGAGWRAVGLAW